MRDVLLWIEHTGLGQIMRESGPWTYAFVNTAHTPELSRFSEHDDIEKNNAAIARKRGNIGESFTTLFHVKG